METIPDTITTLKRFNLLTGQIQPPLLNLYDPYGSDLSLSGASSASADSPYKYSGKEWDSLLGMYDFDARTLNPIIGRFTTMDSKMEDYYSISPYAYCAGNPVNLVDPYGNDWYRTTDENGKKRIIYDENIYDDKTMKERGIKGEYLGKTYLDLEGNIYYSLFGTKMKYNDLSGNPYSSSWLHMQIDNLLIKYYSKQDNAPEPFESFYWEGLKASQYGKEYPFVYRGRFGDKYFQSSKGTVFVPVNNKNNARATIKESPKKNSKEISDKFGYLRLSGHFLILNNRKGTDIVRIYFANTDDALLYMSAIDKQFAH